MLWCSAKRARARSGTWDALLHPKLGHLVEIRNAPEYAALPYLRLFRPDRDSRQLPQGTLADRVPITLYLRPLQDLFLDRRCQMQQVHNLADAGTRQQRLVLALVIRTS